MAFDLKGRELILGVSGGIAAYKSAALVSMLAQEGIAISVVVTDSARQFVGDATFAALSGRPVSHQRIEPDRYPLGAHIELAQRGELLCIAPATANFLSKAATGMADDLLSTLYLCFRGSILMAPAMNAQMWQHPAVQRNVVRLQEDGVQLIPPEEGWLSCREVGAGRMAAPAVIANVIRERLAKVPRPCRAS